MKLSPEKINELKRLVTQALDKLYQKDFELIKKSVGERSIAFRLGVIMECLKNDNTDFKGYDLDTEYNKNKDEFKKTPSKPNGAMPDLILHKRGNNWNNLLIIEVKRPKKYSGRTSDRQKLKDFTNKKGVYRYGLGIFIILGTTRGKVKLEYYL